MNPTPQEITYCVVCDNIFTPESSENEMVCSDECRVTFADFEVLCSFKVCIHCSQPVTNDGDESNFCSDDCSQTHEYVENLRTHCEECEVKMPEPITSKFCGELCEKKFALDRLLDEQEEYIESKRQEEVEDDHDY
jgi:hypothetical protein